jgi:hypothetical protein
VLGRAAGKCVDRLQPAASPYRFEAIVAGDPANQCVRRARRMDRREPGIAAEDAERGRTGGRGLRCCSGTPARRRRSCMTPVRYENWALAARMRRLADVERLRMMRTAGRDAPHPGAEGRSAPRPLVHLPMHPATAERRARIEPMTAGTPGAPKPV